MAQLADLGNEFLITPAGVAVDDSEDVKPFLVEAERPTLLTSASSDLTHARCLVPIFPTLDPGN